MITKEMIKEIKVMLDGTDLWEDVTVNDLFEKTFTGLYETYNGVRLMVNGWNYTIHGYEIMITYTDDRVFSMIPLDEYSESLADAVIDINETTVDDYDDSSEITQEEIEENGMENLEWVYGDIIKEKLKKKI